MTQILAIAHNTFRQTVRQRLFYNVIIFGVFLLILGMIIGTLTFGYPDRVVRSIGLSGSVIALDLMALLVGVSLIHQEIERKTLFVVLTRPLRRWQYALGRYLGLVATLFVSMLGLSVIYCVVLVLVAGTPAVGDFIALGLGVAEASVIGGMALVLSAFSTPTLSAGMGLGLWIAGATTDALVRLTRDAGEIPHAIAKVVSFVLPAMSRFNFRDLAVYQQPIPTSDVFGALVYAALYSTALVALASAVLSRRQMV